MHTRKENLPESYLILPMPPTPNGRLHIGHMAGPYLRADALARNLRVQGKTVVVVSGSDVYENWILLAANRDQETPENTCFKFNELIKADFNNLNIEFDEWVNPLDPEHFQAYIQIHEEILSDIILSGTGFFIPEEIPVSSKTGEFVIGVWIGGKCPQCQEPVAGNSCVKCGAGFQPREILNPYSRLDGSGLHWIEKNSWFVEPQASEKISNLFIDSGVGKEFIKIAQNHINRIGTRVRISQPGQWGIKSKLIDSDSVITNTFYAYSVYCAKVAAKLLDESLNCLNKESSTKVISFFGKDNAGIGLIAPYSISLSSSKYRSFNFTIVNHLLHFEGKKCSTSRKHGIWVSELINNTSIVGDELRYCLAQSPLEDEPSDVSISELVATINKLRSWQHSTLDKACTSELSQADTATINQALHTVELQISKLHPHKFQLKAATDILTSWMFRQDIDFKNRGQLRGWLEGIAILATPIMPVLAKEVWSFLGFPQTPKIHYLGYPSKIKKWKPKDYRELKITEIAQYIHLDKDYDRFNKQ